MEHMNDEAVFTALLQKLDRSPLWAWDSPPVLWAVICEEPVVITPAIILPEGLGSLLPIAAHWRSHMADDSVPVDTLALTCEGHLPNTVPPAEVRDCVVVHKDGGMSMFRHTRGSLLVQTFDPTEVSTGPVEAMREVGASAWR